MRAVRWRLLDGVLFFILMALIICLSRWLPHPPGLTAVGAMGLFAGARWRRVGGAGVWLALPAALLVSDTLLGFYDPKLMFFVYAATLASVPVGRALPLAKPWGRVPPLCLLGSTIFFLVSNSGWWLVSGFYPLSWEGLWACHIAALPFYGNHLLGCLIYLPLCLLARRLLLTRTRLIVRRASLSSPRV